MQAPGPFIQTVSGRRLNPFEPAPEEIEIGDIAAALGNQCRFGGHIHRFYSVAQHAYLTSLLVEKSGGSVDDCLWALLHDAAEAYLVDLPHPIKHRSEAGRLFQQVEEPLQAVIIARFGLPDEPPEALKAVDRALLATERRSLSQELWSWPELDGVEPVDLEIEPWPPDRAAREFLARYDELESRRTR